MFLVPAMNHLNNMADSKEEMSTKFIGRNVNGWATKIWSVGERELGERKGRRHHQRNVSIENYMKRLREKEGVGCVRQGNKVTIWTFGVDFFQSLLEFGRCI